MLVKVLTDGSGHCEAKIGVDIDLADCHGGGLAELILGNAYRTGHLAAVFVYQLDKLLRNGRRAMKNNREAGQTLFNLFENIKSEVRICAGLELICAM